MNVRSGTVSSVHAPWPGVTGFTLLVPGLQQLRPGQYVLCATRSLFAQMLPDAFVPVALDAGASTIDCVAQDADTAARWRIVAGCSLPLIVTGPLGKGFTIDNRARRALLVDAGSSGAPLLWLARFLVGKGIEVVYLASPGESTSPLPASALPAEVEFRLTGDRGSSGQDLLRSIEQISSWPDALYVAGGRRLVLDLASLLRRRLLRLPRGFAQAILVPRHVVCGVGACGLCFVETRAGPRRLCRDGLVFDLLDLA